MMSSRTALLGPQVPDVSFVVPCYNEDAILGYTVRRVLAAFERAGYCLELVLVDNGSTDRTGEIIQELAVQHPSIIPHRVDQNLGYGNGVLSGIPLCTAPWIGILPADGQVDAEDAVRLYEAVTSTDGRVVGKVRRRFRMDGLRRKLISVAYNLFVRVLWPTLDTLDVNGNPKLLPRDALMAMHLTSKQWFLDPELMVKAHYMGLRIYELNVFARLRGNGVSHVQMAACWEFFRKLLVFRFTGAWRRDLQRSPLTVREYVHS